MWTNSNVRFKSNKVQCICKYKATKVIFVISVIILKCDDYCRLLVTLQHGLVVSESLRNKDEQRFFSLFTNALDLFKNKIKKASVLQINIIRDFHNPPSTVHIVKVRVSYSRWFLTQNMHSKKMPTIFQHNSVNWKQAEWWTCSSMFNWEHWMEGT